MTAAAGQPDAAGVLKAQGRISLVINFVLSGAFFVAVFGASPRPIALAAPDNLAFDFVVQSLVIGFLGSLVPALLVAAERRKGAIADLDRSAPTAAAITRRATLLAAGSLAAGIAMALALSIAGGNLGYVAALAAKMVYGAGLGWVVCDLALRPVLKKAQ